MAFYMPMTIALTTSPGGLFRRIGRNAFNLDSLNAYRGVVDLSAASIVSLGTGIDNIEGQYQATNQQLVDSIYSQRDQLRGAMNGLPNYLRSLAQATLIKMADDDGPLSSLTVQAAMTVLISQMITAVATVEANVVSVAVTTGSNTGTAVCIASVKGPDGKNREYIFAETIVAMATTDFQSGTATAGSETWLASGEISQFDSLAHDWPLGSGASSAIDATDPAAGANYLANGVFEDWTVANTPDNWTITVGTAGATVFKESTVIYRGAAALKIVGTGAELTAIRQKFSQTSGGSSQSLLPSTVYAFNCFLRVSAVPAAGTLIIELVDNGGTAINNDQGVAQQLTKALTAATTSYVAFNGFFQTPKVLPASTPLAIRFRLSVALDNTKFLYIDDAALLPATEFYQGGPYIAIFPGSVNTIVNDTFSVAVSNGWGSKFQKTFERYFGMRSLGMQVPSATGGGESIADTLIY